MKTSCLLSVVIPLLLFSPLLAISQSLNFTIAFWTTDANGFPLKPDTLFFGVDSIPLQTFSKCDTSYPGVYFSGGLKTDIRTYTGPSQSDTFFLYFCPNNSSLPVLHWKSESAKNFDNVRLTDGLGPGFDLLNVNMQNVDSCKLTNAALKIYRIITSHPHSLVSVNQLYQGKPFEIFLHQNYPNPFNPSTKISYEIRSESFVVLGVYDLLGREIHRIVNERKLSGRYEEEWNAEGLPGGIYFIRIQSENVTFVRKMVLLR